MSQHTLAPGHALHHVTPGGSIVRTRIEEGDGPGLRVSIQWLDPKGQPAAQPLRFALEEAPSYLGLLSQFVHSQTCGKGPWGSETTPELAIPASWGGTLRARVEKDGNGGHRVAIQWLDTNGRPTSQPFWVDISRAGRVLRCAHAFVQDMAPAAGSSTGSPGS